MKIVGICGSLREDSYNKKILKYIKESFVENIEFTVVNIEAPLYNDDLDITNELISIQNIIKEADGVVIVSPEYNFSVPGVLKNFLDWMSIEPSFPFDKKKVAIMSSSIGSLGGARMQYHLRQVLQSLNANVINKPEVFIGSVKDKFDGDTLIDEKAKKNIDKLMNELVG